MNTMLDPARESTRLTPGEKVRAIRLKRGLPQKLVARLAGMQKADLCAVERGYVALGITRGLRLADALGVTLDEIFSR